MMGQVLELFAGAGGAALGLHRAGFEHAAMVEWDASACATLRAAVAAGYLSGEVIEGDVRTIDFLRFVGIVRLLHASAPCQEWSSAGRREGAKGERNGWPWTLDVIDVVKPTWVTCENVDGMLKHASKAHVGKRAPVDPADCPACWFHRILIPAFEARFASVQWTVFDAASLAVPQHRKRLVIVAGPRPIRWPHETAAAPDRLKQGAFGFVPEKRAYSTVREALNLPVVGVATAHGPGEPVRGRDLRDLPARTVPADQGGSMRGGNMGIVENAGVRVLSAQTSERKGGRVPCESSIDAPAPTVRSQEGQGLSLAGLDPKHMPATLDAPALRSGGKGHSAPPAYLETGARTRRAARKEIPADVIEKLVGAPQGYRILDSEAPAPAIQAQGSRDRHGHEGGHAAPLLRVLFTSGREIEVGGEKARVGDGKQPDWFHRVSDVDAPTRSIGGGGGNASIRAGSRPDILDRPSPVVSAVGECKGSGEGGNPQKMQRASDAVFLGAGIRRLKVGECAILQAFPKDWPWQGTITAQYRQVGNAWPPTMAEAIGRAVLAADRESDP